MKKYILTIFLFLATVSVLTAQTETTPSNLYLNSAEKMLQTNGNLKIGGYGEVHYNQPVSSDVKRNGIMDVHRFVMMLGYQFSEDLQFVTELEFEHVSEVYVEQAFCNTDLIMLSIFAAGCF
jgi:hypothetical protein